MSLSDEFVRWLADDDRDELAAVAKAVNAHFAAVDQATAEAQALVRDESVTIAEAKRRGAELVERWGDLQADRVGLAWLIQATAKKFAERAGVFAEASKDSYHGELATTRRAFAELGVTADSMQGAGNAPVAEHQLQKKIESEPAALAAMARWNRAKQLAYQLTHEATILPHGETLTMQFPRFARGDVLVATLCGLVGSPPPTWGAPQLPTDSPEEKRVAMLVPKCLRMLGLDATALTADMHATIRQLASDLHGDGTALGRPLFHADAASRVKCRLHLDQLPDTEGKREVLALWRERDAEKPRGSRPSRGTRVTQH